MENLEKVARGAYAENRRSNNQYKNTPFVRAAIVPTRSPPGTSPRDKPTAAGSPKWREHPAPAGKRAGNWNRPSNRASPGHAGGAGSSPHFIGRPIRPSAQRTGKSTPARSPAGNAGGSAASGRNRPGESPARSPPSIRSIRSMRSIWSRARPRSRGSLRFRRPSTYKKGQALRPALHTTRIAAKAATIKRRRSSCPALLPARADDQKPPNATTWTDRTAPAHRPACRPGSS